MCRDSTTAQSGGGKFRVRSRGKKITTQCKKDFAFPVMHRPDRVDGVESMISGWLKVEFHTKSIEKGVSWALPNSHGSITLNVAVASDGTKTCALNTNLPAHQHQVYDLLNVSHGILVLS